MAAKKKAKKGKSASKKSASRKGGAKKSSGRKAKKSSSGKKRKPNAAFMAPMTPSSQLSNVVGSNAIPRTEVTKKLWGYIKRKGLQDNKNRRMINADENLRTIFGGKSQV